MKVKLSVYERAINRLAQGTAKDCDLADELEQTIRASMKAGLDVSARIVAVVAIEREACAKVAQDAGPATDVAAAIRARGGK